MVLSESFLSRVHREWAQGAPAKACFVPHSWFLCVTAASCPTIPAGHGQWCPSKRCVLKNSNHPALLSLSPHGCSLSPRKEHFRSSMCPQYQLLRPHLGCPVKSPQAGATGVIGGPSPMHGCDSNLPPSFCLPLPCYFPRSVSSTEDSYDMKKKAPYDGTPHPERYVCLLSCGSPVLWRRHQGRPPSSVCLALPTASHSPVCLQLFHVVQDTGELVPPLQECHT